MRKKIRKGALRAVFGQHSPKSQAENNTAKSTHAQDKTNGRALHSASGYVNIFLTSRKTGRRLGGLHCHTRRLIAAPLRGVFLLVVNRTHGVDMPIILTGAPYGNPFGLLFPCGQSANLYGVAHPLGGGVGFTTDNLTQGKRAMSKPLNGAIAHTQNNAFVSPYFEQSSPLGMCLKAVTEPVSCDALRTAKSEINTILAQVADALDVIAERENLAHQCPSCVSYSDGGQAGSATDLMAALLRLTIDMNTAINRKLEGQQ